MSQARVPRYTGVAPARAGRLLRGPLLFVRHGGGRVPCWHALPSARHHPHKLCQQENVYRTS